MAIRAKHLLIPLIGLAGVCGWDQTAAETSGTVGDTVRAQSGDTMVCVAFETLRGFPDAYHQEFQEMLRKGRFRCAGKMGVVVKAPRFGMPILVPNLDFHSMPVMQPRGPFDMPQVDPYGDAKSWPPTIRITSGSGARPAARDSSSTASQ